MTNSKLVVAAIAALGLTAGFSASKAYAQDDPCGGGGEEGMGDPCGGGGEGEGGGEATAPETTAASEDGGAMAGDYPQAVDARPRVLPKGMLEVTGALDYARLSLTVAGVTATSDSIGLGLGARYGIAPKIDGALSYGFSLKDFEIKGDLGVALQYSLSESDKMGMAAKVTTGYSVVGEEFSGVGLGVNLIYRLTPKISVQTPGDQLTMGGSDFPKPVAINLPVGFGYQANEKINAYLMTSIGTIGLSPSGNTLISDATPITVGGSFSPSNKLDIGAMLSFPDVQHAGDFLVVGVNAAMRM